MGKVIGSGNICIARLSDGYSNAVVMLYRTSESAEKPLRMLYNFSSGGLSSGVDGKTLTECLNGWTTERGADSHYAISASVRSTEEYGAIESSSWSDNFLIAEKGETIVSVTLYQRAENAPEKPSSSVTYNFYTGAVTGSLGAWNTSIPDYTEYPLWSISATASAVLDGGTETDEISASEWSTPKKVAEDGKSPIEIFLSAYSYVFPADEDGIVKSSEYEKFSVEVLAVRGGKSVEFTMSAETTGISFITVSGNTVKASSSTAMTGDSASVKLNITAEGETYVKTISLAKAKQSKPTELWFAWSKSETIFTPKDSNFWIVGTSFIYFSNSLIGNIPFTNSWVNNWAEIEAVKTEEYCYLWCKTSESGTPFLFTGATGKTGACTMYQYALGDAEGNTPADSDFSDTMPTIQGTGKMLWTRYKVIPAGGLAGDVEWSEAKLVGTDNSEVYARITDAETEISEITKSGGLIEQAITKYDSETGENIRSSITQTADKIAMKVGDSGTVTDKDGNTLAGITISDGRVVLQGDTVIEQGSLSVENIDTTNLFSQEFIVKTGGSIESQSHKDDSSKGFKFWESGHIDANDITLGDDVVFGGTMQNDVIKTVKEAKTGTAITSYDYVDEGYWNEADLYDYFKNTEEYSSGYNITKNGVLYSNCKLWIKESYQIMFLSAAEDRIQIFSSGYSKDSMLITLNGTTLIQCGPLYSSWIGITIKYYEWKGTKLTANVSGKTTSSGNTYNNINVNDVNVVATDTTLIIYGVMSATKGQKFRADTWPTYSITLLAEEKGVYLANSYPLGAAELGNAGKPFESVYAKKGICSEQISIANDNAIISDNFIKLRADSTYDYWIIQSRGNNFIIHQQNSTQSISLYDNVFYTKQINTSDTSNSVYGAKFTGTQLCDFVATGATTQTLKYNLTNYQWITVYAFNQYSCGVYTFHSSLWPVWNTNERRLVLSTDTRYVGLYFPSVGSVAVSNLSPQHEIVIYGYK